MATSARGHVERLPSGSFRVHVYARNDPVTGKPQRLKQTCTDEAAAAAALGQLLSQADGDRFPNRVPRWGADHLQGGHKSWRGKPPLAGSVGAMAVLGAHRGLVVHPPPAAPPRPAGCVRGRR